MLQTTGYKLNGNTAKLASAETALGRRVVGQIGRCFGRMTHHYKGARTIFRLGEQKVGVKNNHDNQIQSITLRRPIFRKKVYASYNGAWGKAPEAGEFSRIFVL